MLLFGVFGLLTTPATLAVPGGRVSEYLFWSVFLVFALVLTEKRVKWCAAAALLSALWLAHHDRMRGEVWTRDFYRMREQNIIRHYENQQVRQQNSQDTTVGKDSSSVPGS
ncbi:MAG TPA: hypothetical protein PKB10_06805 [Tepidisphaeraceae bacterium]|nr:hypothetical protein [Tepidisphaeraceae bacterium]